ncbi:MAG: hypothetical protein ABI413_00160 [Ktedonobacteraceae bacterium]
MSDILDYQVDHLLLLVGSNPLPNAVAGKLLVTAEGTITLIHSQNSHSLAGRLKGWLCDAGFSRDRIGCTSVAESDADSVYSNVFSALKAHENKQGNTNKADVARVGLNYTGGTKVMSVHAYRAVEKWAQERHWEAVFSYLDAHTLRMHIDSPASSRYVGRGVDLSIKDLLTLHDWEISTDPLREPALPESAAALLAIHSNPDDAKIWVEWLHHTLFPKARHRVRIDPPIWISKSDQEVQEQLEQSLGDWKRDSPLRKLTITWPDLPKLRETMSNELGQVGAEDFTLTAGTGPGPGLCTNEKAFGKWLSGTWLESAVLSVLQDCSEKLQIKECCMDLLPKLPGVSKGFQFDVVAIRGYQLFAFSCTTEDGEKRGGRELLKQKLFEVYIRARQMGGDEACAALICCAEQEMVDGLEQEVRRDMSLENRIRIFGRNHLANLSGHIEKWICEQSKEG